MDMLLNAKGMELMIKYNTITTLILFLLFACGKETKATSSLSACHDFEKKVPKQYLKDHEGVCLIENGFNQGTDLLFKDLAFIFPIIDESGKPCSVKKCPIFMTLSFEKDASLGVLLTKFRFDRNAFKGDSIEPTLTYMREKYNIIFKRNN